MSHQSCPHERAITDAVRTGEWSTQLREHRDSCLECAELTLVLAALSADAEELMDDAIPLPDPGFLWMRSRLAERERDFRRATRAIVWVQRAALAVVMGIGLVFAPGLWALIKGAIAGFDLGSAAAGLPRAAGSPTLVLVMSLMVLGGVALWELTMAHEG